MLKLFILALLLLSNTAYSAGFDCLKATSLAENVICTNPQLSDLDDLLMSSYKKTLQRTGDDDIIKIAQRDWLKNIRNKCQTVACLKQAYTSRIAELNEVVATAQPATEITKDLVIGKYQRYFQGKADTNSAMLIIKALADEQLSVNANAVWIGNQKTGNVNTAEIEGSYSLTDNKIHVTDGESDGCQFTITFIQNALIINDDNGSCGGMNVTFNGQYKKITH